MWTCLIGRVAWWPVCEVWFARRVGLLYLVGLLVGNCCSCIGLLPLSYVYRGGVVGFSGNLLLVIVIVCGALPFWK